jgi:hypothetical protein
VSDSRNEQKYTLSHEREDQLRDILYQKGFALYTHVPSNYPMKKIVIQSAQINKDKIAEVIFKDETYTRTFGTESEKYESNKQTLLFLKGSQKGIISYSGINEQYVPKDFTREEVEKVGKAFAEDITLSEAELELTFSKAYDHYYVLEYNEIYKDQILFCNYVKLKVTEEGVNEARVLRYVPTDFVDKKEKIFPADEALYNFVESVNLGEGELYSIKSIDLGYDLGINSLEENGTAEVIPYYRIKLHNEFVYFVNAYTNELRTTDLRSND